MYNLEEMNEFQKFCRRMRIMTKVGQHVILQTLILACDKIEAWLED